MRLQWRWRRRRRRMRSRLRVRLRVRLRWLTDFGCLMQSFRLQRPSSDPANFPPAASARALGRLCGLERLNLPRVERQPRRLRDSAAHNHTTSQTRFHARRVGNWTARRPLPQPPRDPVPHPETRFRTPKPGPAPSRPGSAPPRPGSAPLDPVPPPRDLVPHPETRFCAPEARFRQSRAPHGTPRHGKLA